MYEGELRFHLKIINITHKEKNIVTVVILTENIPSRLIIREEEIRK